MRWFSIVGIAVAVIVVSFLLQSSCTEPANEAFRDLYLKQKQANKESVKRNEAKRKAEQAKLDVAVIEASEAKAKLSKAKANSKRLEAKLSEVKRADSPLLWVDYLARGSLISAQKTELNLCFDSILRETAKYEIIKPMYDSAITDIETLKDTISLDEKTAALNRKLYKRGKIRSWIFGVLVGAGVAVMLCK